MALARQIEQRLVDRRRIPSNLVVLIGRVISRPLVTETLCVTPQRCAGLSVSSEGATWRETGASDLRHVSPTGLQIPN
jgi:hypothetical protein